jgi:hypothetical protein
MFSGKLRILIHPKSAHVDRLGRSVSDVHRGQMPGARDMQALFPQLGLRPAAA